MQFSDKVPKNSRCRIFRRNTVPLSRVHYRVCKNILIINRCVSLVWVSKMLETRRKIDTMRPTRCSRLSDGFATTLTDTANTGARTV